ncbi:Hypothetical_protein [Hexamita inflata]|uniref:Hypothetical_protein n=1 Tax=Hexamita inflata TaxID=28002 RepID=A0AA86P6H5_9EUKA|nr:Hypothetical protein HINF_LOCUS8001 [Hexamita inflata]CAI9920357.1 Hypothetical protein HINF_LOCUS8002 [Hexamita inflata]CAI9920361.1 Hypothetical protein HINF_LOCUS8006 [Hexamita inflata]CAI9932588.1 Hypothetical protein HINF_LOCUS20233 [Hexamita inflata]CAI9966685.1 Hypothetical protein HINF_LOCUS54330 [Hexamita inflata]
MKYEPQSARFTLTYRLLDIFWKSRGGLYVNRAGVQVVFLYKQFKKNFKLYIPHLDGRSEGQIKSFYLNVVHTTINKYRSLKKVIKLLTRQVRQNQHLIEINELVQESTT